jgi:serine/threonine protein phosphatase PrpC
VERPRGELDDLRPEVYKARLHVGDTSVLCTDGLPTRVPDGNIQALPQARETRRQLVEAASRAGGMDNITHCGTGVGPSPRHGCS